MTRATRTRTRADTIGRAFAYAIARHDFGELGDLLHPNIDFRALTPTRTWEPADHDAAVEVLRTWWGDCRSTPWSASMPPPSVIVSTSPTGSPGGGPTARSLSSNRRISPSAMGRSTGSDSCAPGSGHQDEQLDELPIELAVLQPGETMLDLDSGSGMDSLLAADSATQKYDVTSISIKAVKR